MKSIRVFFFFFFLEVEFSIYLNRRVFVMVKSYRNDEGLTMKCSVQ